MQELPAGELGHWSMMMGLVSHETAHRAPYLYQLSILETYDEKNAALNPVGAMKQLQMDHKTPEHA